MEPLPRTGIALVLIASCLSCPPARSQEAVASLGKQRAAASALKWEVREAGHPTLGPIVFAVLKVPLSAPAGNARISSNVYVSCERSTARIAIELANGTRADDTGGLKPNAMPRLTCHSLSADGKPVAEPLEARWIANELGDVMARGLWPSTLRACASINILEDVVLPPGWGPPSARFQFDITPYARELDQVFARCGEPTAYPTELPRESAWILARATARGHTNVRAKPDIRSALVTRVDPGDVLLTQRSEGDWWRVKSRPGARTPYEGYIRRDRLDVK